MTEHSKIGPSALHRLLNCPGSHQLSANKPQGRSSAYAAEGTVAHAIVEQELSGTVLEYDVGDIVVEEGHDILVDQEMMDGVKQMVAFCEPLRDAGDKHWVEARVDLSPLWGGTPPEPIFGTVDFASYSEEDDVLYVVDLKYGRLPVSPHDNPQALAYSLGAVYELGRTPGTVINVIIQPRGQDGHPIKIASLSGLDLMMWAEETLKVGVDALFSQTPPLVAGEHCRFCPAKIDCPALYEVAKKQARAEFSELPLSPVKLDDTELAEVLNWAEVLNMWIAEVRAEASGRLEKGSVLPNWKLVPKRAMRKWSDPEKVATALNHHDLFFETKLKSPTQVEKIDKNTYNELFEKGLIDKSSSGTTLAPDTDPRDAVKAKRGKDEFEPIDP